VDSSNIHEGNGFGGINASNRTENKCFYLFIQFDFDKKIEKKIFSK
jgi:hypothetical protein